MPEKFIYDTLRPDEGAGTELGLSPVTDIPRFMSILRQVIQIRLNSEEGKPLTEGLEEVPESQRIFIIEDAAEHSI